LDWDTPEKKEEGTGTAQAIWAMVEEMSECVTSKFNWLLQFRNSAIYCISSIVCLSYMTLIQCCKELVSLGVEYYMNHSMKC
jgi:hypothetical protein